jgi:hypothetical protein
MSIDIHTIWELTLASSIDLQVQAYSQLFNVPYRDDEGYRNTYVFMQSLRRLTLVTN